MSKDLEAIKYLNDTCINFLDRTKELYCTVTFTRKRAEILRDNIAEVDKALKRLEAIDNAEPSEALECLENIWCDISTNYVNEYVTIKQALLKAQEPKKYLKWEDLEFKKEEQTMKVTLNGKEYILKYKKLKDCDVDRVRIMDNYFYKYMMLYTSTKQFFNDLHLEVVEE